MLFPIEITPIAQNIILDIKHQKNIGQEYALRIGIKGDGCQKDTPFMAFDTPRPTDKIFEHIFQQDTLTNVVIHPSQVMYLFDWVLDYKNQADEKGFYFYKK